MADGVGAAAAGTGAKWGVSGAAAGAAVSGPFAPIGAIIGGAVGLLGGALAGGISKFKQNKAQSELDKAQTKASKLNTERQSHAQRESAGAAALGQDRAMLDAVGSPGQQQAWKFRTFGG